MQKKNKHPTINLRGLLSLPPSGGRQIEGRDLGPKLVDSAVRKTAEIGPLLNTCWPKKNTNWPALPLFFRKRGPGRVRAMEGEYGGNIKHPSHFRLRWEQQH